MKEIGLIDYGMGNLNSVQKAFEFVGAKIKLIDTPDEILAAEALILPGVGNFGDGIEELDGRNLRDAIVEKVKAGTPLIGICLGMQLMFDSSEEAPGSAGLGLIPGQVLKFELDPKEFKVPQMGWNIARSAKKSQLFSTVSEDSYFYFVHSYYCCPEDSDLVAATTDFGFNYCSAVNSDNIFAAQFHPEKSQDNGLQLLKNFVEYVEEI